MTENNNNRNDKIIDELYKMGHRDLPPSSLDNTILNKAHSSQILTPRNHWRPWLAAASVVFAIPMIWYITQNNELIEYQTPIPSVVAPKAIEQAPNLAEEAMPAAEMAKPAASKPYAAPAMSDRAAADDQSAAAEAEKSSGTAIPSNQSTLEANRQLLKNELKAKKRTIKPSNLDPVMALELQQFEQYLSENRLDDAEQLLIEMQHNYPDFNYTDLIAVLADAKDNQ